MGWPDPGPFADVPPEGRDKMRVLCPAHGYQSVRVIYSRTMVEDRRRTSELQESNNAVVGINPLVKFKMVSTFKSRAERVLPDYVTAICCHWQLRCFDSVTTPQSLLMARPIARPSRPLCLEFSVLS